MVCQLCVDHPFDGLIGADSGQTHANIERGVGMGGIVDEIGHEVGIIGGHCHAFLNQTHLAEELSRIPHVLCRVRFDLVSALDIHVSNRIINYMKIN
jgi:hypothetical protein